VGSVMQDRTWVAMTGGKRNSFVPKEKLDNDLR
jgi:hypothetical protein